jgi:formylglycine-generating enzyme required for sulfatase activity
MKKIMILIGSVILITAFTKGKEKSFLPPGTVQINDSLFADETEISNFSWREFVDYNKQQFGSSSVEYISSLPDTLVWRAPLSYNEPYVLYYYSHPAYKDYPVVGISYEQAVHFCRWRTERVHAFLEIKEGKRKAGDLNEAYTGKLKFEYRLPTKQEWEALALPGLDAKNKKEQKGQVKYNIINTSSVASSTSDNADVTAPVYSYWPNKLGVYNVIGNVSELVAGKGIAKGGSWKTLKENLDIWKDEACTEPNSYTGFRCVCVVKK